jgi:hypothetical protein
MIAPWPVQVIIILIRFPVQHHLPVALFLHVSMSFFAGKTRKEEIMKTIGIFKSSCPDGWTRISAWDGLFLRGGSTYGATGGNDEHNHTVGYPSTTSSQVSANAKPLEGENSPRRYYVPSTHTHVLEVPEGVSSDVDNTPPCIDVVFCYMED